MTNLQKIAEIGSQPSDIEDIEGIFEKKEKTFDLNFKTFYEAHSNFQSPYVLPNKFLYQLKPFFAFKKIQSGVQDMVARFDNQYKDKKSLSRMAENFISNNNYKDLNAFIKRGFKLSDSQVRLLVDNRPGESLFYQQKKEPLYGILAESCFISTDFQSHCQEILIKLNKNFNNTFIAPELSENVDYLNNYTNYTNSDHEFNSTYNYVDIGYDRLLKCAIHMHNKCINPKFSFPLFTHILKVLADDNNHSDNGLEYTIVKPLQSLFPYIQPFLSKEDKIFLIKEMSSIVEILFKKSKASIVQDSLNVIVAELDNDLKNIKSTDFKGDLLKKVELIYGQKEQDNTVHKFITITPLNTKTVENEFLPQHISIINDINLLYQQFSMNDSILMNDDIDKINKIFLETLPDTIKKYSSINLKFRESIKNVEGKNAHELLEESLNNILLIMQEVELNLEQAKVNDLSIINRKNKIKSMG